MSLGTTYNNDKKGNDVFSPTVFSPYKMNNAESVVDQTCIAFHFWNNNLKISIYPKKDTTGVDGQALFDYDNGISIYLNHTKARILAEELKRFLTDPVAYDNSGVPSGQGLITVSRGTQWNSPTPVIIIRKIDANGTVLSSFAYQTKSDYYFSVRGYNEDGSFEKHMDDYKNFEIYQFITILEEFYKAATCAVAYTVLDQFKFETDRQKNWRDAVSAKLGIETRGSRGSFNSTSYFSTASGSSSTSHSTPPIKASIDDID